MKMNTDRRILPLEQELIERVGWFIKLRWYATIGVFIAVLLGRIVFQRNLPVLSLCAIGLGMIVYNTAFRQYFLRLSRPKAERVGDISERKTAYTRFTRVQIIMDWATLSLIAHYSGGIRSPVLMFFIFHILIASILLSRRDCYVQATLAVCFVVMISLLEYSRLIPHVSITNVPDAQFSDSTSVIAFLLFFASTLYTAVFIATSIAAALRSKERSLVIVQADLRETYEDLEEAAEAKSRFILTVTHELRSPLAAVQSMFEVISAGYAGEVPQKVKELIERSGRRIHFLLELVNDLLDLAAEQLDGLRSKRIDVDINDTILEVVDGIQGRAEAKGVSLTVNIPDSHIIMEGNERDLEKLFGNLLSNAVKYTLAGGQANLTVDATEDRMDFTVTDTGIGISEEVIEKLFDDFFRAENAREMAEYGTGLGLAIAKRIVDEYKGEISVKSELGYGTQFFVSLPLRTQ